MFCEIVTVFHKQTVDIDQPQITKGHASAPLLSVTTKYHHHVKERSYKEH